MLSTECRNRLANWKFVQATDYLGGCTEEECSVIWALAYVFGDSGWFDGKMGVVVRAALRSIGVD